MPVVHQPDSDFCELSSCRWTAVSQHFEGRQSVLRQHSHKIVSAGANNCRHNAHIAHPTTSYSPLAPALTPSEGTLMVKFAPISSRRRAWPATNTTSTPQRIYWMPLCSSTCRCLSRVSPGPLLRCTSMAFLPSGSKLTSLCPCAAHLSPPAAACRRETRRALLIKWGFTRGVSQSRARCWCSLRPSAQPTSTSTLT